MNRETYYSPLPGDIGLVRMLGVGGPFIRFGQWLNGDGFADFEHAFMFIGGDLIIEAYPGGAQVNNMSKKYMPAEINWCTGISNLWSTEQRAMVPKAAMKYKGVPYSVLDYFAIAAHTLHIPGGPLLKNYVSSTKHMICSQLCDQIASDCGVKIFDDGRWPGYISPGGLYTRDREILQQR